MKLLGLTFCLALFCLTATAQNQYAVSSISKSILPRAGAVVRNSETVIELKQLDEVYYRKKYAITILNSSALDEATVYINYDKTTSIKSVKGTIYDEFGTAVLKITEKNMQDVSAVSDISLYDDDRVKYFKPIQLNYPFTIEYEYETKSKQSLYIPSWIPGGSSGVAIESSVLKFICPEWFKLRHKEFNYTGKVEETINNGLKSYQWQTSNLLAIREEPYSPDYEDILLTVKLAPEKFAWKNIEGHFSNWQEFGKWMSDNLLKGRDELPASTKSYITEMVKDIPDPKEKARKIYSYLQNKTRYISVQIGIGGYQPYSAMDIDRLGYGDCKGLANYMHALLKAVNIDSYYTVVHAGAFKKDLLPDFTSMQGNHIILCLPFKNDTTWLECTSKDSPFGFLGDFTDDRYVLACTPDGGKVMRTPKLKAMDNKQIRLADFKLDANGSLKGIIRTTFSGSQFDNHHVLLNESQSEQLKKIPELYPLPNLQIQNFEFKLDKSLTPETRENITIISHNYCNLNERTLSIRMNSINQMRPLREVRNRINPVKIVRGYFDEDVFRYQIPDGFSTGLPTKNIIIEKPFGKYSAEVTINGNIITYKRKMLLNEGTYNAEQYEGLVDFFQSIADADNMVAILNKI